MIARNEFDSRRFTLLRIELPINNIGGIYFVENVPWLSTNLPSITRDDGRCADRVLVIFVIASIYFVIDDFRVG
jgi:hypothetical protein